MSTVTVTGKISASAGATGVKGSVDVMLCGYGSRVPRVNGLSLVGRITVMEIEAAADGSFTFQVAGNDSISPAGTYYTVTIRDSNGDIAQVNAYRFLNNPPSYDLNTIDPYDPTQPPPPLPPLLVNNWVWITTNPAVFDGSVYTTFGLTLAGDVTSQPFVNAYPGTLYTFAIIQDAAGHHNFTWPTNVHNAAPVPQSPNMALVQTFVADTGDELYPIGPATVQYWQ